MDLWVVFALVMIALVVIVLSYAVGEPSRVMSGMWRFRLPGWPEGVQEDDDAHWSWSRAPRRRPVEPERVVDATDDGGDDGPPDVGRVRYEVRSVDRERS